MYEGMNYQKEKRKNRLTQKSRKKISTDHKNGKSKSHIKYLLNSDQYPDSGELSNSR